MPHEDSIKLLALLGQSDRAPLDPAQWRNVTTRLAWVKATLAKLRAAQRRMDARCSEACERLSEDAFERLCAAEQAKVTAILDELRAAGEQDKWPKTLYFGGI